MLIAAVRGKAAAGEAEFFVHFKGGNVVLHNEGIAYAKALLLQQSEQLFKEQSTDSAAFCGGVNVDGILHRPLIGGAGIERPAVGVAEDFAVFFVDKPRVFLAYLLNAAAKFLHGGNGVFKGVGGLFDIGRVDGEEALGVLRQRRADFSAQALFFRKLSLLMKY